MYDAIGLNCTSNVVLVTETETGGLPDGAIDGDWLGALVYVLKFGREEHKKKRLHT